MGSSGDIKWKERLRGKEAVLSINGTMHTVANEVPADTSLNTFIREYANLHGTKFMCLEGGCGVCLVSLQFSDPITLQKKIVSVNSCLFPVFSCHRMAITTIEGVGNKKTGYDKIQKRLANFSGTQCGFCSPGMVMNLYSLIKEDSWRTMSELVDSFDGNLCRCTGYRPILDTAKSFAVDVSEDISKKILDIEDFSNSIVGCNGKCAINCNRDSCDYIKKEEHFGLESGETSLLPSSLNLTFKDGSMWYKVETVEDIFEIYRMIDKPYILVSGNTAKGVYKGFSVRQVYIDINSVAALKVHSFGKNNLSVGANVTLTDTIKLFSVVSQERHQSMSYLQVLADHIKRIANLAVRNVGTLAGNLSIKHQHNEFPSDLFTIFESVGATVTIASDDGHFDRTMSLLKYLNTDMNKRIIKSINFPFYDKNYVVKTYKITRRAQNAKAEINAGFCFNMDPTDKFKVLEKPSIVFGGICSSFVHATQTENFLIGKSLKDLPTFQQALSILEEEVLPDFVLPSTTPAYKKGLAQSLFYKFVLSLNPAVIAAKYMSGAESLTRPLSSGRQEYHTDQSKYPINQPVLKIEGLPQCAGEAQYTYDIPTSKQDLFAQIVITDVGPAVLDTIDASKALRIPGVVRFFSANDIPGKNTFTAIQAIIPEEEELFANSNVLYAGQPVGIIVAKTQAIANQAAKAVYITYKSKSKPMLNVDEIVKSGDKARLLCQGAIEPTEKKVDFKHKVKGDVKLGGQYAFAMETFACYTVPLADGLDVYTTSQWIQSAHEAMALALDIPENSINMKVERCGGGFGLKVTRNNQVAVACSLAAYLIREPVRIITTIEDTMEAFGKRCDVYAEYDADVNNEGQIQSLSITIYEDLGSSNNDPVTGILTLPSIPNVYDARTWKYTGYNVKTDKPSSTWLRAPGTLEAVAITEHIMEHIAKVVNLDPTTVRLNNIEPGKYPIETMITDLKSKADYDNRLLAVEKFNSENVWKKRGMSLIPMKFNIDYFLNFNAMISIYRNDGTVVLTHGGIEIGQGANTKAVQICAHELGVPLDYISVKASNNLTSPNNGFTGASVTGESVCLGIIKCCEILNKRLEPIRQKLSNPTWKELIAQAYIDNVDLNASAMMSPLDNVSGYSVFGVTAVECEIDVLTGEHKIIRADILQDAGNSINPLLNIGQIEGAFIMGIGYLTSEELQFDPQTGQLKTNRTWNYKVPGAKDIPIDFRVYIMKNSSNPSNVLGAKAVGEPPICMSVAVLSAIRHAVQSARKDMGLPNSWIPSFNAPFTVENIFLNAKASGIEMVLKEPENVSDESECEADDSEQKVSHSDAGCF